MSDANPLEFRLPKTLEQIEAMAQALSDACRDSGVDLIVAIRHASPERGERPDGVHTHQYAYRGGTATAIGLCKMMERYLLHVPDASAEDEDA